MRRLTDIVCIGAFAACAPQPNASDTPAAPPDELVATLLEDSATLTWHHDTATRFRVRRSPDGATFEGTGFQGTFDLPAVGVTYWFTVKALGEVGWGDSSAPSNPVERTQPGQVNPPVMLPPYSITVAAEPSGAHVTWGSITAEGFTVVTDPPDLSLFYTGEQRSADLSGLRNGVTYRVSIAALHGGRLTPVEWSDRFVPASPPDVPTSVSAAGRSEGATVSWTPPANAGGSPITGWEIADAADGHTLATAAAAATSTEVAGLENGARIAFVVRARNAVGVGSASQPSNAVVPAEPASAPLDVAAVRLAAGTAQVTWTAPQQTGGLPVLSYVVEAVPSGAVESATDTTVTLSHLPSDAPVQFRVTAVTGAGAGAASVASAAVLLAE